MKMDVLTEFLKEERERLDCLEGDREFHPWTRRGRVLAIQEAEEEIGLVSDVRTGGWESSCRGCKGSAV
jgi:hypothetical protein